MTLVKHGIRAENDYFPILDGGAIPDNVPVLVDAERFLASAPELLARKAPIGVIWPNHRRISELAPYLDRLSLIALVFPSFRDGRAYSQARQLREQHLYRGELRATGDVLRDQIVFMARAGFDSFAFKKEADARAFHETLARYSVYYQPAGDGRAGAASLRLSRRLPFHAAAISPRESHPAARALPHSFRDGDSEARHDNRA